MKLVQMFFDWLKQEPQASVRGVPHLRPKDASANKAAARLATTHTLLAQSVLLTPVVSSPLSPALSTPGKPTLAEAASPVTARTQTALITKLPAKLPIRRPTKQDLYDAMVRAMCERYQVRVRKWRTSMSGIAWYVEYRDGRIQRLIESPRPKSPMSAAIFLHEIGHHHIGLGIHKPRCLEEYLAWKYSLEQMEAWNIEITDRVRVRVSRSLRYAVRKAQRRGIQRLPQELLAYAA